MAGPLVGGAVVIDKMNDQVTTMVVTARDGQSRGNTGGSPYSIASGAFTPSNNSLLVVCFSAVNPNAAGDISVDNWTCAGGGWTYTKQLVSAQPGTFPAAVGIFTAPVATGASMTATVTHGTANADAGGGDNACISVFDITNYNTSNPTGGLVRGPHNLGNGAVTLALSSPPFSNCIKIGASAFVTSGSNTPDATSGTGWTEIHQQAVTGWIGLNTQYRVHDGTRDVTWDDLDTTGDGVSFSAAVGLEIRNA